MSDIRKDLIAAHRAGDEEWAKRLSQERERAKKKLDRICAWPGCGVIIRGDLHCKMHDIAHRFYSRRLKNPTKHVWTPNPWNSSA